MPKMAQNNKISDKSASKETYIPTIELEVLNEKDISSIQERASVTIKNSQLLSSRKFNDTLSMTKINPFQNNQKYQPKNKVKTSLEIYSNNINVSKTSDVTSGHKHQRNWSGIKSEETKIHNISATAISARSYY